MIQYDPDSNTFFGPQGEDEPVAVGVVPNVMWHITDVCPLGCEFCFARKTDLATDRESIPRIIAALQEIGVQKVDVSGGEPLVYSALPDLIAQLTEAGIYRTITTSGIGTVSNRTYIANNVELFTRLIVSLDGPSEETHNWLRANRNAWRALCNLMGSVPESERRLRGRINTVVTRPMVALRWLDEMVRVVENWKVREWCLIQPHPANKKQNFEQYDISDEEFSNVLQSARHLVSGETRLIWRNRSLYSSYWSVQPDGHLVQHTADAEDGVMIDLLATPASELHRIIEGTQEELPSRRHES